MGIIKKIMDTLFAKKVTDPGYYYVIDFTRMAERFAVGGDINKKIYLAYNNIITNESYPYTRQKVKELKRYGIPVIDRTIGVEVPERSMFIPSSRLISGRLEIKKIVS